MINMIRAISAYDYIGSPTPQEIMTLESKRHRHAVLFALAKLIDQYTLEIEAEKRNPHPNMRYINARIEKINEMRGTLKAAQKVNRR